MRTYPDRPNETTTGKDMDEIKGIIERTLDDKLPDCPVNRWFLGSVYYANMIDEIISEIWEEV